MPHVNIWIRKEDMDKWKSINDKPLLIHNAVNGVGAPIKLTPAANLEKDIIRTPAQAKEAVGWSGSISKSFSARRK